MKLDKYENELLDQEDQILATAHIPRNREKALLMEAAKSTLNKDKRINIRMSSRDLASLQRKANRYGMPYQTLISSILHRYVSGDLTDAKVEQANSLNPLSAALLEDE